MMQEYCTKILIVDDTKANLTSLRAILEDSEIDLYEANNGNDALKILFKVKIDIVLLDVQMPDISGFEVARLMRENKKTMNIPIIFITAISKDEKFIFKGYELGAVDYLYKPISNEILKSKVKVFVRLQKQTKIIQQKSKDLIEKVAKLKAAESELARLVRIDDLTGAENRRSFRESFELEWKRAIRAKSPLSVLMIDIDFFKIFNDTYGHLAGDECLKSVVATIKSTVNRQSDTVARFGGEEFVVLLPDTDLEGSMNVAEEIRKNIELLGIENKGTLESNILTVSIGVAVKEPLYDMNMESLLKSADDALYIAKSRGRNICCRPQK